MANLRTTVILKTDTVESTPRTAALTQSEMGLQRKQHKQFISEIAIKNLGAIFQEEGDGYWLEFPSVTAAVLAAIEMHQNLRSTQAGKSEKQRLAIRVTITVGDILHQEQDWIGTTMSLTARIEKVTPPDEIYLSHAAWLVLNKAEVQTSFVNEFNLKGFSEPEKVYKVDQKFGIRNLTNQYIVLADAKGFSNFIKLKSAEVVENFLLEYDDLMNDVCAKHGGVIRQVNGDMYFVTFEKADQTISALKMLCLNWKRVSDRYNVGMSVGAHKGSLFLFRSYAFSEDVNTTAYLSKLGGFYKSDSNQIFVVVSGKLLDETSFTGGEVIFQPLDGEKLTQEIYKTIVRDYRAYRLVVE
jgi:class 3 adenylate cyclase